MAIHERLRYARETLGLTGAEAARQTQIAASAISEFENARRQPSLIQLQRLAMVYRRSVSFFLEEGPISQERVLWRERPTERREELEADFLRFCERFHNLELWSGERLTSDLPYAVGASVGTSVGTSVGAAFGFDDAQRLAKEVRDRLQLGDRPGQTLLPVLEGVCGVKIQQKEFDPTGTAASTLSETFGPAVLLNSRNRRWRRNFDVAHELFHLLTWRVFRAGAETAGIKPSENEESLANCFASSLLLPEEAVRSVVSGRRREGKLSLEDLFEIARQFDVSVEALAWRLHSLYRPGEDKDRTERVILRARELAPVFEERLGEPADSPPWPPRYFALAVKALRRGRISTGRFAEYLGISRQAAMKIERETMNAEEIPLAPS